MSDQELPKTNVKPYYSFDDSYRESQLRYAWKGIAPTQHLTSDEHRLFNDLLRPYEARPLGRLLTIPTKDNVVALAFTEDIDHQGMHSDWYDHHVTTLTPTTAYQEHVDLAQDIRRHLPRSNIVSRDHGETLDDAINNDGGAHAALVNQQLEQAKHGRYDRRVIPVSHDPYRCILAYADKKQSIASTPVRAN